MYPTEMQDQINRLEERVRELEKLEGRLDERVISVQQDVGDVKSAISKVNIGMWLLLGTTVINFIVNQGARAKVQEATSAFISVIKGML